MFLIWNGYGTHEWGGRTPIRWSKGWSELALPTLRLLLFTSVSTEADSPPRAQRRAGS
jgi:hypothetical protein